MNPVRGRKVPQENRAATKSQKRKENSRTKKQRVKNMRNKILDVIIVILAAILIFSGWKLWQGLSEYKKGEAEYDAAAEQYVNTDGAGQEKETEGPKSLCPISVDFNSLLQENSDVVGWIYCEGTPINYPVLRGATNDTYLHTTIGGQSNSAGSIFMDYRCKEDLSGINTVIYGHNMKNGSMFAALHKYSSQEFYEEHPVMWYLTPSGNYRFDLIAGYVGEDEADVYDLFTEQSQLTEYLSYARSRSTFTPDEALSSIPAENIPRIVVLSTCSYEFSDARYVVVCLPVPDGAAQ